MASSLDSILQQAGINPASLETQEPQPVPLTNADFDDILQNAGFPVTPEESEGEGEVEDINDDYPDDTHSEQEDYSWDDRDDMTIWGEEEIGEALSEIQHNVEEVENMEANVTMSPSPEEPQESPQSAPIIPPNSPTLLINDSTSRFSGAEWFQAIQESKVILAGLGGIGSWCALQLARMNPALLCLYDDDVVEEANMSGQLYGRPEMNLPKADALINIIANYTSTQHVYALVQKFTWSTEGGDIMMCGFDNMEARKTFFNAWTQHLAGKTKEEKSKCLFIDGRLSMDVFQVFCITGDDGYNIKRYEEEFLFDSSEADVTVCSMKQTTYLACMIGSYMVNMFTNFIANTLKPIIPYNLPFFTEYDAQNVIFKMEN